MHSTRESGLRRCAMSPPSSSGAQPAMTATSPVEQQSPPYANPRLPHSYGPTLLSRANVGFREASYRPRPVGSTLLFVLRGRILVRLSHDGLEVLRYDDSCVW